MAGADLARTVTPPEAVRFDGDGPHVVGIDTGIKLSIVRQLREHGAKLTLLPCDCSPEEVLAEDPDIVFLANGPGDPAALDYVVDTVRGVIGKKPVFGICLGHQLLCRAVGLRDLQAALRPPRRQPPGQGPGDRPDRHHLAEPRLRGRGARRRAADRRRRAGPLGHRLRRRRALAAEPLRPHGRGPRPQGRRRRHRPVPPGGRARARTTPATSSTASWPSPRDPPDAAPRRHREDPPDRLRADRDRPGRRVRLLRRAGLQGAARGGLRSRPRQLQPGDDHDRPRVRHRDLHRAAAARAGDQDHRKGAPRRAAADARRPDRAEPGDDAARGRHPGAARGRADRRRRRRRSTAPRTARSSARR